MQTSSLLKYGQASRNAQDALYAADTGLQYALGQLRVDMGWAGTQTWQTIENNGIIYGRFKVGVDTSNITINGPWRYIPVKVVGLNADQTATRQLSATIRAQSPAAFFMSSISNLVIDPGSIIDSDIMGKTITFTTPSAGRSITVNGSVQYFENVFGFDPNNPYLVVAGGVAKIDPVTFVAIDKDRYQALAVADGYAFSGDLTLSGLLDRTLAHNGVIYVDGNVFIDGSVVDPMVVVATGNIFIVGNLTYNDPSDPLIQLGLFAKGNIIIANATGGDQTVQAFLISEKMLVLKGTGQALHFKGAMAIRGSPTDISAINLSNFRQRHYAYHKELFTNCTIPAMSHMADIFEWRIEGSPVMLQY